MMVNISNKTLYTLTLLLALAALAACSDDDGSLDASLSADTSQPTAITINVGEQPWQGESISMTRAGETLAALKQTSNPVGDSDGFGLYCSAFNLENKQVTWNTTTMKWDLGNTLIWPQKTSTPIECYAYAPYKSSTTVASGQLAFTTPENYDTDLLWAYYRVTKDNDGAVGEVFSYDFEDEALINGWVNGHSRVIESDTGNKWLMVTNPSVVNPWDCQLFVDFSPLAPAGSYTLKFKAKASDVTSISANLQYPEGGYASRGDFGSASLTTEWQEYALTTTVTGDNATRLVINIGHFAGNLYFDDVVLTSSDAVTLTFRHALARLSLGTIANNSGNEMMVSNIQVTGNLYQSGSLSLANGSWSGLTNFSPSSQTVTAKTSDQFVYIAPQRANPVRATLDYMFIPGPQVTVSYDVYQNQTDFAQLTSDMFYEWNGRDGSAAKTDNTVTYFDNNIGTEVNNDGVICGTSTVHYLTFADLTAYDKLVVVGTPGMRIRMLFNRLENGGVVVNQNEGSNDGNGGLVLAQYVNINDDGYAVFDLQSVLNATEDFVHLNSIKNGGASGTVSKILLFKKQHSQAISGTTTLEQGINKTVNLTLGVNHEVVIE